MNACNECTGSPDTVPGWADRRNLHVPERGVAVVTETAGPTPWMRSNGMRRGLRVCLMGGRRRWRDVCNDRELGVRDRRIHRSLAPAGSARRTNARCSACTRVRRGSEERAFGIYRALVGSRQCRARHRSNRLDQGRGSGPGFVGGAFSWRSPRGCRSPTRVGRRVQDVDLRGGHEGLPGQPMKTDLQARSGVSGGPFCGYGRGDLGRMFDHKVRVLTSSYSSSVQVRVPLPSGKVVQNR